MASRRSPAGQAFDPHQHEAISHQPSATVKEEHVIEVVRIGLLPSTGGSCGRLRSWYRVVRPRREKQS
jgi:hypothetical protein